MLVFLPHLSFKLLEERDLDLGLRLTHLCVGLMGISEENNNRFARDSDTFSIEFDVLQDTPMEMSVNS